MQLFSDEYLMHYGIKGMKWKKKKFRTPESYYEEGMDEYLGRKEKGKYKKLSRDDAVGNAYRHASNQQRRADREYASIEPGDWNYMGSSHQRAKKAIEGARKIADIKRNDDLKKARTKAYKKNQRRIARQQKRAKVKKAIKNFVDPPLKVEHHTYLGH